MKRYPSIGRRLVLGPELYVYDKLDGSNIRAEWTSKHGFYKFGRRNGLLDDSNPWLLEAPDLIIRDSAPHLDRIFRSMNLQRCIAFFEFWGVDSFAGTHTDQKHRCDLIDVGIHKKGIVPPDEFERWFRGSSEFVAELLQRGFTEEDWLRYRGMTYGEGVVVKGPIKKPGRPLMFKVKSDAWLARLKEKCGDNQVMFNNLR